MTRRYYIPELPDADGQIQLPESEAVHALRVMRVKPGDSVIVFDGTGHEAGAVVTKVDRHECWCDCQRPAFVDRESTISLHMGISLPKPDRARALVERLTELGVTSITPLTSQRTQRPALPSTLEKLKRTVIEASKQCERNRLLEIHETQKVVAFVEQADPQAARWITHPGKSTSRPVSALVSPLRERGQILIAMIGPEGGWTQQEVDLAESRGFELINFGKRIYRIETSAIVVAALVAD